MKIEAMLKLMFVMVELMSPLMDLRRTESKWLKQGSEVLWEEVELTCWQGKRSVSSDDPS